MTTLEEDFDDFVPGGENPDLVAAASSASADPNGLPELPNPLDGPVTLVAGFRRMTIKNGETTSEEVRKAWVRELNGEDEERIAKAKLREDGSAFVDAILEAGVERLGNVVPTRDDINSLVMGDRDFLLLEIARVTYGNDLDFKDYRCYNCGETLDFTVHLDEESGDVPIKRLDSVDDTQFEIRLKDDRVARMMLPTVADSVGVLNAKTEAEANTVLIAASVIEIRGPKGTVEIKGDSDAARRLGVRDRKALVDGMADKMPGPQYNEVRFVHPDCGKEIRLTVTLADLFPGM